MQPLKYKWNEIMLCYYVVLKSSFSGQIWFYYAVISDGSEELKIYEVCFTQTVSGISDCQQLSYSCSHYWLWGLQTVVAGMILHRLMSLLFNVIDSNNMLTEIISELSV